VWDYNATEFELQTRRRRLGENRWGDYGEEEAETLTPGVIATATSDNIQKATDFVNDLSAIGGNTASCSVVQPTMTGANRAV
jgi:hypothetical protein